MDNEAKRKGGQKFYGPRHMAACGEGGGSVIFYLPFFLWESIVRAKGEAKGLKIERKKEKISLTCSSIFMLLGQFPSQKALVSVCVSIYF